MKLRIVLLSFMVIGSLVSVSVQINAMGRDRSIIKNDNNTNINFSEELIETVSCGNIKKVKNLIQQGADVNHSNFFERIPLISAVYAGHAGIVKLLIENRTDVNCADKYTNTPLICAVIYGRADIVALLIENRADVNHHSDMFKGRTALMLAIQSGYTNIVKILCEKRINVNLIDEEGKTALDYATTCGNEEMIEAVTRHLLSPKNCGMKNTTN